jgi:hypothetical protein
LWESLHFFVPKWTAWTWRLKRNWSATGVRREALAEFAILGPLEVPLGEFGFELFAQDEIIRLTARAKVLALLIAVRHVGPGRKRIRAGTSVTACEGTCALRTRGGCAGRGLAAMLGRCCPAWSAMLK